MNTKTTPEEKFWSRVDCSGEASECWLWTGVKIDGYGQLRAPHGKRLLAHRYSAMLHLGMFDQRLQVLHHCDTPACVRPDHLYFGTPADNMRDRDERGRNANAAKTQCKNGHAFTEANTAWRTATRTRGPSRACRACARERARRRYQSIEEVSE